MSNNGTYFLEVGVKGVERLESKCWRPEAKNVGHFLPPKSPLSVLGVEKGVYPHLPPPYVTLRPSRSVASSKRQRALHRSAESRFEDWVCRGRPLSVLFICGAAACSFPTITQGLRHNATQIVP